MDEPDYVLAKKQLVSLMDENELRFEFAFLKKDTSLMSINELELKWEYTLLRRNKTVCTGTYAAGIGHAPSYAPRMSFGKVSILDLEALRFEAGHGLTYAPKGQRYAGSMKPILPDPAYVMSSLLSDASAIDYVDFEEWASTYGMNPDSRKAETIYRACLKTALALRAHLGEPRLTEMREVANRI